MSITKRTKAAMMSGDLPLFVDIFARGGGSATAFTALTQAGLESVFQVRSRDRRLSCTRASSISRRRFSGPPVRRSTMRSSVRLSTHVAA